MRNKRQIIAIKDGEKRVFESSYEAAKALKVGPPQIMFAVRSFGTVSGWQIYDSPDRLRERIKEIERVIEMLESL